MNFIKNLPIPISGLILALFSLGNLVQEIHPSLKCIFGIIGLIFLILIIMKLVLYPQYIKEDFKNPIIVSSSGTFTMSLMILSTYIIEFTPTFAYTLWIIGLSLHILLMIYFTYNFIMHNFDYSTVFPSYWITYVGITMGAITSHSHNIEEIGFIFFIIGFISMMITTPIIINRYIKYPEIDNANKPLICIFTALFSILIVGYSNTALYFSKEFIIILYIIACIFYIFSLYKLINYRNLEFYPSFSAFTFPFVISALATKQITLKISENIILTSILNLQTAVATILVIYVLIRYVNYLKTIN